MKNKILKDIKVDSIYDLLISVTLFIFMIASIYPFYYVIIMSITHPDSVRNGMFLLPVNINFDTYIGIINQPFIYNALIVSVLRTFIGTVLTVLSCSFFAFILSKEFKFKKLIYRLVVITIYLNAGLIPWYITMKTYGLVNNFLVYIFPIMIPAFYVVLLKTFIEQMPASLEESAIIDGAGYIKIYTKIIFPLIKPALATIAVFAAVNQWNSWMDNYFLVQTPKLQTLQLILYNYLNRAEMMAVKSAADLTNAAREYAISPFSIRMTITVLVTLPIILVYPFFQKYFVKGIMIGAIKG